MSLPACEARAALRERKARIHRSPLSSTAAVGRRVQATVEGARGVEEGER